MSSPVSIKLSDVVIREAQKDEEEDAEGFRTCSNALVYVSETDKQGS